MSEVRLQVVLARAGLGSRRACEQLITDGVVRVNGQVVSRLGARVDPARDEVRVRGRAIPRQEAHRYLILHKPPGVVTTASDPQGRTTVLDLVRGVRERVHPVGRLDLQSEGLLLLTNDGPLTNALTHPRSSVPRTYHARVRGTLEDRAVARLGRGIRLDGTPTRPLQVRRLRTLSTSSWVEVTVHEGRKHLVRDALAAVGHPVVRLRRVSFGPVKLGALKRGEHRPLTDGEVAALRRAVRTAAATAPASGRSASPRAAAKGRKKTAGGRGSRPAGGSRRR